AVGKDCPLDPLTGFTDRAFTDAGEFGKLAVRETQPHYPAALLRAFCAFAEGRTNSIPREADRDVNVSPDPDSLASSLVSLSHCRMMRSASRAISDPPTA